MIITIIGIVFIVLAVVTFIAYIYLENNTSENHEILLVGAGVSLFIGGIIALVSLVFILSNNTPYAHEEARVRYNAQVTELTNTKEAISHITDDYARSVSVTQYNNLVREFKQSIEIIQLKLNNPWVNWFNNYAYKDFDANAVDYIATFQ